MSSIVQSKRAVVAVSGASPYISAITLDAPPNPAAFCLTVWSGNKQVPSVTTPPSWTAAGTYTGPSVTGRSATATGLQTASWQWTGTAATHNFGAIGIYETDILNATVEQIVTVPSPATDTAVSTITADLGVVPAGKAGTVFAIVGPDSSYDLTGASTWPNGSTITWSNGYLHLDKVQQDSSSAPTNPAVNANGVAYILAKKDVAPGDTTTVTVSWSGGTPIAASADQVYLTLIRVSAPPPSTAYDRTVTDLVGIADAAAQAVAAARTLIDPVGLADTVTRALTAERTQTDPVGLTDATAQDVISLIDRTITDAVGLVDTVSYQVVPAIEREIVDPVGLADTVDAVLVPPIERTITDAVGLTDAAAHVHGIGYTRTIVDPVGLTDAVAAVIVGTPGTLTYAWLGQDKIGLKLAAGSGPVRVDFSATSDMASPISSVNVTPTALNDAHVPIPAGLPAGALWYYRAYRGGTYLGTAEQFRTAPASGTLKVGVASCRNTDTDAAALSTVDTRGIELFLNLGDLHYRDNNGDLTIYRTGFDEPFTRTNLGAMMRGVRNAYIWSDHDFCGNLSNRTATGKANAQQVFRERVPAPTLPSATGGIYHTFTELGGRVRFVMLDTRSFRDANGTAADGTMLGTEQKAWLQALLAAADAPLTFVCSAEGWHSAGSDDDWGFFQDERTVIAGWITASATEVVFLCGDMHRLAIATPANGTPGGVHVWHAAPLNQTDNAIKGGPYADTFYGASQYGEITIVDNGPTIVATFVGVRSGTTDWATTDSVTVATGAVHNYVLADPIGATDTATRSSAASRTQLDLVGLTDAAARVLAATAAIVDAVGLTDDLTPASSRTVAITDPVGIDDTTDQATESVRDLADTVGLTDTATSSADWTRDATDPVGVIDQVVALTGQLITITDTLGVTDTAERWAEFARTPTSPVGLLDQVVRVVEQLRQVTDPIGIVDTASGTGTAPTSGPVHAGTPTVSAGLRAGTPTASAGVHAGTPTVSGVLHAGTPAPV